MAACRQRWQHGCMYVRMCWPQWPPPSQPSLCAGSQVTSKNHSRSGQILKEVHSQRPCG